MPKPKDSEQLNMPEIIKEIALQEIAQNGSASLSLRAIARRLKITAPAIYNHYRRKEDLITALIIDAYTDFGNSQRAAIEHLPAGDYWGRLRATGVAYRHWAVINPQRYLLIFGTPFKGYKAPMEKIALAASGSMTALLSALEEAKKRGALKENVTVAPASVLEQLKAWACMRPEYSASTLYLGLIIWSRVHGLVMFELGKHYPEFITDPGEIYDSELESIGRQYIRQNNQGKLK